MANYDFNCNKCGNIFEITMPMKDYNQDTIKTLRCPYCESGDISREYTAPAIKIPPGMSDKTLKNLEKVATHKSRQSSSEFAI